LNLMIKPTNKSYTWMCYFLKEHLLSDSILNWLLFTRNIRDPPNGAAIGGQRADWSGDKCWCCNNSIIIVPVSYYYFQTLLCVLFVCNKYLLVCCCQLAAFLLTSSGYFQSTVIDHYLVCSNLINKYKEELKIKIKTMQFAKCLPADKDKTVAKWNSHKRRNDLTILFVCNVVENKWNITCQLAIIKKLRFDFAPFHSGFQDAIWSCMTYYTVH
jgi:hypothetical protein